MWQWLSKNLDGIWQGVFGNAAFAGILTVILVAVGLLTALFKAIVTRVKKGRRQANESKSALVGQANAPKPEITFSWARISEHDGKRYAVLPIQNDSTHPNGYADNVVARINFWNVQSGDVFDVHYGFWFDEPTHTATISPAETKELYLACLDDETGAVVFDDRRKTGGDGVNKVNETCLGFGEWLVHVKLLGAGFKKSAPRLHLVITENEPPVIKEFFHPFQPPGRGAPYGNAPRWPE